MGCPGEMACLRVCTVIGRSGWLPPDSRHWITSPNASTTCGGTGPISFIHECYMLVRFFKNPKVNIEIFKTFGNVTTTKF